MALSELSAFESAYQNLAPLDTAARRRALTWLSDALGESLPLKQTIASNGLENGTAVARRRPKAVAESRTTAATTRKRRGPGRPKKTVEAPAARTYRRMPDPGEVMAVYGEAGTISGLAEHYDVPVYTVYSWARRLRSQGYQIGREQ